MMTMSKWIESGGGPLIMLPSKNAAFWRGGFAAGEAAAAAPIAAADYGGTDYGWACAENDLIGVGRLYGAEAIVFNDLSLPTAWQPLSGREGVVVRVDWSDERAETLDALVTELTRVGRRALMDQENTVDLLARDLGEGDAPRADPDAPPGDLEAMSLKQWALGPSANLRIVLSGGKYLLFDSAYEGGDPGPAIRLALEPGDYRIRSGFYRPRPATCLRLHWFHPNM